MSITQKPSHLIVLALIAFLVGIGLMVYFIPFKGLGEYHKPEQAYEYYYIYAEEDGRELMRVPVAISIDDELITEDNKRYKIVQIEGNKGIARFVEMIDIEKYKPKQ
jgi:hypothetical protein